MAASDLIYELETDILKRIAYHLSAGNLASADYMVDRLLAVGMLKKDVFALIEKYRADIVDGVSTDIEAAALAEKIKLEAAIPNEVKTLVPDFSIARILDTYQAIARTDTVKAIATMAERAGPTYVKAVNRASLLVSSGSGTLRGAVAQAIRETSDNGIPVFTDKLGRKWTPEGYVSTVVRTANSNLATQIQLDIGDHYGADLVEVSSHAGARPLCAPYQGRIYSRSGNDKKYPALDSTSYGQAAGLRGVNCAHVLYPYWPGLSTKTFSPEGTEAENATIYKQSQKQREIERAIRAEKRTLSALESGKNIDPIEVNKAKQAVKNQQLRMREFIDESGRTRRYDREQIVT